MNFILSNIQVLTLIWYITDYIIISNYNQYQRVIIVIIVKNALNNYDKNLTTISSNFIFLFDKFTLKTFNQLSYNYEIKKSLIARYLFSLTDHYFLKVIIKSINIILL